MNLLKSLLRLVDSPVIRINKYKSEKEEVALDKISELGIFGSYGNPVFFKELINKIMEHPDFVEDVQFMNSLDEVIKYLPPFKVPLPYPLSVHLQYIGNGKWGLIPHTKYEPTLAQLKWRKLFSETAVELSGGKGLINKRMSKKLKGKTITGPKIPDKTIKRLKRSLRRVKIRGN